MKRVAYTIPILFALFFFSCNRPDRDTSAEHGHSHDELSVSHTVWTDKSELFVEFNPLIVGEITTFAAHFSEMEHFKAIGEGKVTVSLVNGNKGIRHTVNAPSSPGIFRPALQPKKAGVSQLIFDIQTPTFSDRIVLNDIPVYEDSADAIENTPHGEEAPNTISYLKEQAWKTEFANAPVERDTIFEIIRAGGEFIATQGNEKTISATASGILVYKKRNAIIGSGVRNREVLFAVAGGGIIDRDLEARFLKAKATFEQAKASFDRKSELYDAKAISKTELEEATLAYQLSKTEYETLAANYSKGGKNVYAPQGGYLKQLHQPEGAFVEAGEPLAVITETRTITLRADVGPTHYPQLASIHSANFISNNKSYSLDDLGGKLLSYGKSVNKEQPKVPVYFELNNTADLLPGGFVEVFIKMRPVSSGLLIPTSALLEEYGNYSVIVQKEGESFELREIQTGIEDGQKVQVLSGLAEGERVVTEGAYMIKMASMSGTVPAHGHAH